MIFLNLLVIFTYVCYNWGKLWRQIRVARLCTRDKRVDQYYDRCADMPIKISNVRLLCHQPELSRKSGARSLSIPISIADLVGNLEVGKEGDLVIRLPPYTTVVNGKVVFEAKEV